MPTLPANVKIKIAILLPLTGPNAALGQALLNAAQLAIFDVGDNHFELMPRDTGNGEDIKVAEIARDAVADGARLLIGPLFAGNVAAVKPIAAQQGVNVLALSTDTALAGNGIYIMGFAPGAQVDRVMTYAHAHGMHRFAALIPVSAYGDLVADEFGRVIARNSDTLIDIERYDTAKHSREDAIAALAAKRDQIDALFLPEGGDELNAVVAQLSLNGFDSQKIKLLGTGLWDADNLGGSASFLTGGWYAASDPHMRQNFLASYRNAYDSDPPRLATLAYDATALAAILIRHGGHFDRAALTNPNGFSGIDGIFRLTNQGLVERGLAIDEVTPVGGRAIDPAPATFAGKPH
jgi:ABC-type branched-subunit amino acid transport system substrate-binding protein